MNNHELLTDREQAAYKFIMAESGGGLPPTVREIAAHLGINSTSVVHRILKRLEELGLINRSARSSRAIRTGGLRQAVNVPILGTVTAGLPILAVEQVEDYLPVPGIFGSDAQLFALKVKGLSMKNAGILDGDIVIADRSAAFEAGDIVVALIEDEATVKTLKFQDGMPILQPENPDFDILRPHELQILGKVVGSFRKF